MDNLTLVLPLQEQIGARWLPAVTDGDAALLKVFRENAIPWDEAKLGVAQLVKHMNELATTSAMQQLQTAINRLHALSRDAHERLDAIHTGAINNISLPLALLRMRVDLPDVFKRVSDRCNRRRRKDEPENCLRSSQIDVNGNALMNWIIDRNGTALLETPSTSRSRTDECVSLGVFSPLDSHAPSTTTTTTTATIVQRPVNGIARIVDGHKLLFASALFEDGELVDHFVGMLGRYESLANDTIIRSVTARFFCVV